jgi:hypothetical protein
MLRGCFRRPGSPFSPPVAACSHAQQSTERAGDVFLIFANLGREDDRQIRRGVMARRSQALLEA